MQSGATSNLFQCFLCPKSYHINCIPPGARFNTMCVLCPSHPNQSLPSKDRVTSKLKDNAFAALWDEMVLPEEFPQRDRPEDNHFRLPTTYQQDVLCAPPVFTMIKRLDYDSLPQKEKSVPQWTPDECCTCKEDCDESCLNRYWTVQCGGRDGIVQRDEGGAMRSAMKRLVHSVLCVVWRFAACMSFPRIPQSPWPHPCVLSSPFYLPLLLLFLQTLQGGVR